MRRFLSLTLLAIGVLGACASSQRRGLVLLDPDLPRYTPSEAVLFDDSISVAVLSTAPPAEASRDPKLRERSRRADKVFLARIVTVKWATGAPSGGYSLEIEPVGTAIVGESPTSPLPVTLPRRSAMASRLDAGAVLVGRIVVLFVRTYAGSSGPELHFRAEPDHPAVRAAVERAAKALDENGS